MKAEASVLIVDLDNTLFDWFKLWRGQFYPIYQGLRAKTSLSDVTLQSAIRAVNQRARTSEYTFLLDDLRLPGFEAVDLREMLRQELEDSKRLRDRATTLYPTVLQTLWTVKRRQSLIIAHTESLSFYSGYRLKKFGLDGVIDYLYAPEDHDLPAGVSLDRVRSSADEFYELQITKVRHTPKDALKPNATLLKSIIDEVGAKATRTVYVGDNLFKDVAMAQAAGVQDVFAEYGVAQFSEGYDLLRGVSHWTDADVERERNTTKEHVTPSVSIDRFDQLLEHFNFLPFKPIFYGNLELVLNAWKEVVEVQQHFNNIEMTIRNYAITVLGAMIAAIGFTFQNHLSPILILGIKVHLSVVLVFVALTVWSGFYFMDRHWYHRLLKGAVDHARTIEDRYGELMPEITLGTAISRASPIRIWKWRLGSNGKVNLFYFCGAVALAILAAALLLTVVEPDRSLVSVIPV